MCYLIIFEDPHGSFPNVHVVKYCNSPMHFDSHQEAEEWASECLGDTPYQIINTDNFKTAAERKASITHD